MNSETTEPKTPVQRFVMRIFSRSAVKRGVVICFAAAEVSAILFLVGTLVALAVGAYACWDNPSVQICTYSVSIAVVLLLAFAKWFSDLYEWATGFSA